MYIKHSVFRTCTISTQGFLKLRLSRKLVKRCASSVNSIKLEDDLTTDMKKLIEAKWSDRVYGVGPPEQTLSKNGKHAYILSMFPYPSGRLHLGHVRVYTISDVLARFNRLRGYKVIHPMGWDAFGLPAENAARDRGIEPEKWTLDNISSMKKQIVNMGCCFDWDRELATCDPKYYQWTQWLFVKLWQEGLAYKKRAYVYWDPVDQTVLAEEQVDSEMRSWRSGAIVEKKLLSQWFIRTPVFAQKLAAGLESNLLKDGWRDIIDLQKHWIGQIQGFFTDCNVLSEDKALDETLRLWFSSPETLRHAQFVIIQPDHHLASESHVFQAYPNGLKQLNFMVLNPATAINLPVFAGGPEMPIVPESSDCRIDEILNENIFPTIATNDKYFTEIRTICKNRKLIGNFQRDMNHSFVIHPASLKLRDWLVSRQRSWGTPIPAVNCSDCGSPTVVHQSQLPFPKATDFGSLRCHTCGSTNVTPDTDTLDTFMDSSWYYYRYLDVNNEAAIFDPKKIKPYLPVDVYVGGKEHATLHLFYARFMSYFMEKLGLCSMHEPFQNLIPVGVVMGESYRVQRTGKYVSKDQVQQKEKKLIDKESGLFIAKKWEKMSKSKYNGVDPELVIEEYGIDTTRLLSMADIAPTSFRKWPSTQFPTYVNFQKKIWRAVRNFVQAKESMDLAVIDSDEWKKTEEMFFDKRNYYLKEILRNYETTYQISVVVSRLQGLFNYFFKVPNSSIKESVQFERALGMGIICMYPLMPAFSAQLWESFRDAASLTENEFDLDKEVWLQKFPHIDANFNLDLICEVAGQEMCAVKVPRMVLDNLDLNVALEMALEQVEIENKVSRESCEVISYKVEANFRATLNIRCSLKERKKSQRNHNDKHSE